MQETTIEIDEETDIEDLPEPSSDWKEVGERGKSFSAVSEWKHEKTGIRVRVAKQRRPTQMSNPRTSRDDIGYIAEVEGDEIEQLTYDLGSRRVAFRRAHELMLTFPDGDFEPETQPMIQTYGPRDPEDWIE